MQAIPCDHGFVESQTRFGAIPIDELGDCMTINNVASPATADSL
jgi:hypothetical protein